MYFTLIRHAKTKADPNIPITLWGLVDEGVAKASELAGDERIKQLDLLYSSCQTKAIETMLLLAKPNFLPMRTNNDLTEISSFTNKFYTGQEYEDNISKYYSGAIERINGGETIAEALGRFETALDGIAAEHSTMGNIGIVTHGYIMSFFTAKYTDLQAADLHHTIAMPDVAIVDWQAKTFKQLWGARS